MGGSAALGRGAALATGFALLFLFLTLLALIVVPTFLERGPRGIQEEIQNVLEPAERLAARVEFAQARQMEAYQAFLLSSDADSRERYRAAREEEERDALALLTLTDSMSAQVRERVLNLRAFTPRWHLGHAWILNQDLAVGDSVRGAPAAEFGQLLITEQALYDEVRRAARELREVLAAERRRGEAAMARARALQDRITRALGGVGLVAAVVVLLLAWRLRKLMVEAEGRRREALRARREADAILQATGDGVIGMDRDGRCLFLNRAGAEILGYPTRLAAGRDVHDFLHHSHPDGTPFDREDCPILGALSRGEGIRSLDETLWRVGKQPFPVHISLRPLKDGPILKGAVLSFTDMTETRASEESLRQAVQARDEVLAVVSHDLRNPVGTIYSGASLLLELELTREKRREHLLTVKRSASRMSRLIQDLLDVARLEAGVLPVEAAPLDLTGLAGEVLDGQGGRAREGGILLLASLPADGLTAWGDRDRVMQILTNLVENALRVTPEGGQVEVGARPADSGGAVHLWVSDTGPGIPEDERDRLFDRFWQVSRKDKGGAGLGLSIVKGLVEAHGGEVWVETTEGGGSTFWFSLPPAPAEEA